MKDLTKSFPIYKRLLKLYPAAYRRRYQQEMLITTADMLAAAPTRRAKLAVWLKVAADLPVNAAKQQLADLNGHGFSQTPNYVRLNSLLAAVLLLPFCAALLANALDKLINNHDLYASWLWQRPFIGLWVLYFPVAAFMLAATSFVVYWFSGNGHKAWFGRLWPLLGTAAFAASILAVVVFHDSGQCWGHAPWHTVTHLKQAWQCSSRNSVNLPHVLKNSL